MRAGDLHPVSFRVLRGFFAGTAVGGTYLATRIAVNLAISELRNVAARSIIVPFAVPGRDPRRTGETDYADPLASAEYGRHGDWIQKALQELKPEFRSVIVHRLMEGYSTKETAEILGLPVGTVLSRLRRSQEKLKRLLLYSNRELVHETV